MKLKFSHKNNLQKLITIKLTLIILIYNYYKNQGTNEVKKATK